MDKEHLFYDLMTSSIFILNVFVGFMFFFKNFRRSTTHKFISIILFLLFFRTFSIHLHLSNQITAFPHMLLISHLVSRIGLPILFFMVLFEVKKRSFRWFDTIHGIPAILYLANFSNILFKSSSVKIEHLNNIILYGYDYIWDKGLFLTESQVYVLRVLPFVFYIAAISWMLLKHYKLLSPSSKDFFVAVLIYMMINLVPVLLTKVFYLLDTSDIYTTNMIFFSATFFMLLYFFFIPNFLYHKDVSELNESQTQLPERSVASDPLLLEKVYEAIDTHFNITHQFKDPTLTIAKVSDSLNIPTRKISLALKHCKNMNFSQYINELRIHYLLKEIQNNNLKDVSISEVAYLIGFNSINNFYAYFKAIVGCTPKVYYEQKLRGAEL